MVTDNYYHENFLSAKKIIIITYVSAVAREASKAKLSCTINRIFKNLGTNAGIFATTRKCPKVYPNRNFNSVLGRY